MKLLAESLECRSGLICGKCRDREGGRALRAGLGRTLEVPPGAPDYECPLGRPWGFVPPNSAPAIVAHVPPAPAADAAVAQARERACRACDEFNGAVCERQFSCGCCTATWLRWLGSSDSKCPLGTW